MPRNSQEGAARTRAAILDRATALGSVEGLEPLSIGRLAGEVGLSKSGVAGHFASKEELQLAALEAGIGSFREAVWEVAADERPGIARLRALMSAWIDYLERDVFPGGCFLTAASLEFDGRPGPVRETIAKTWKGWLALLADDVATAQGAGDLDDALDPSQVAFELNAAVMAGNWSKQLYGGDAGLDAARASIARLLD